MKSIEKKRKSLMRKRLLLTCCSALAITTFGCSLEEKNSSRNSEIVENVLDENKISSNNCLDSCLAGVAKTLENPISEDVLKEIIDKIENDSIYYDFPCSKEMQDYIFAISEKYEVPYRAMFTIIDRETGGGWHLNGYVSSTNDYGLTQINKQNFNDIYKDIGITKDEILNDPYKAIEAEAYVIKNIMNYYGYTRDYFNYRNICGAYNGWINWESNKDCQRYVAGCMKIMEEKFEGQPVRRILN